MKETMPNPLYSRYKVSLFGFGAGIQRSHGVRHSAENRGAEKMLPADSDVETKAVITAMNHQDIPIISDDNSERADVKHKRSELQRLQTVEGKTQCADQHAMDVDCSSNFPGALCQAPLAADFLIKAFLQYDKTGGTVPNNLFRSQLVWKYIILSSAPPTKISRACWCTTCFEFSCVLR